MGTKHTRLGSGVMGWTSRCGSTQQAPHGVQCWGLSPPGIPKQPAPCSRGGFQSQALITCHGYFGKPGKANHQLLGELGSKFPFVFTHGFGGQGTPAFQEAVRECLSTAVKSTKKKKRQKKKQAIITPTQLSTHCAKLHPPVRNAPALMEWIC